MSIHMIAQLQLDPKHDPRDKRVHERIQNELEPVARDILEEYRRGYTEGEILELARERKEREEMRQQAQEAAAAQRSEDASEARAERRVDPELAERLRELTAEGPVRWTEVRGIIESEGWGWSDVHRLKWSRSLAIGEKNGRVLIARAS